MLELNLIDGKKVYVPLAKIIEISEGAEGLLVAAVTDAKSDVIWHNLTSFALLREGQKISR